MGSVGHIKNSAGMVSGPVAFPVLTFLSVLLSSGTVMGSMLTWLGPVMGVVGPV